MTDLRPFGMFVLRQVLGWIFFWQGYGKVFTWGIDQVYQMPFFLETYRDLLPTWLIYGTAFYTSYAELLGGLLMVVGWKRRWAAVLLGSILIIVTFGHGLAEPIWNLDHVWYRTSLLVCWAFLPIAWDRWHLDAIIDWTKS